MDSNEPDVADCEGNKEFNHNTGHKAVSIAFDWLRVTERQLSTNGAALHCNFSLLYLSFTTPSLGFAAGGTRVAYGKASVEMQAAEWAGLGYWYNKAHNPSSVERAVGQRSTMAHWRNGRSHACYEDLVHGGILSQRRWQTSPAVPN